MIKDITIFKNNERFYFQLINKKEDVKNFDSHGFIIDADEKEARRTIEFIKTKDKKIKIAVVGRDENFNRRAIETLKINYLISPEKIDLKDSLKQRASGLNHVVAKLAVKKNVTILVGINNIFYENNKKKKAKIVSRIIQNIKICRSAKCNIKLVTLARNEDELMDEKQIESIGYSLKMSSQQIKSDI